MGEAWLLLFHGSPTGVRCKEKMVAF